MNSKEINVKVKIIGNDSNQEKIFTTSLTITLKKFMNMVLKEFDLNKNKIAEGLRDLGNIQIFHFFILDSSSEGFTINLERNKDIQLKVIPLKYSKKEKKYIELEPEPTIRKKNVPKQIYQLKISIKYISPPIWHRILISNYSTFAELHDVIQEFFNWGNYHLHEFYYYKQNYIYRQIRIQGLDIDDSFSPNSDFYDVREDAIRLCDVFSTEQRVVNYLYDFGDNWEHNIKLEKIFPYKDGFHSPLCVGGRRATPPEDCGGSYGYQEILEIQENKKHPQYKETITWLGGKFDPERIQISITKMTPREIERKFGFNSEVRIEKSI